MRTFLNKGKNRRVALFKLSWASATYSLISTKIFKFLESLFLFYKMGTIIPDWFKDYTNYAFKRKHNNFENSKDAA